MVAAILGMTVESLAAGQSVRFDMDPRQRERDWDAFEQTVARIGTVAARYLGDANDRADAKVKAGFAVDHTRGAVIVGVYGLAGAEPPASVNDPELTPKGKALYERIRDEQVPQYVGRGAYTGFVDNPNSVGNTDPVGPRSTARFLAPQPQDDDASPSHPRWLPPARSPCWEHRLRRDDSYVAWGIIGGDKATHDPPPGPTDADNLADHITEQMRNEGMVFEGDPDPNRDVVGYTHGMIQAIYKAYSLGPSCTPYEITVGTVTTKLASCLPCSLFMIAVGYPPTAIHLGRGESWMPLSAPYNPGEAPERAEWAVVRDLNNRWREKCNDWLRLGQAVLADEPTVAGSHRDAVKTLGEYVDKHQEDPTVASVLILDALTIHDNEADRTRRTLGAAPFTKDTPMTPATTTMPDKTSQQAGQPDRDPDLSYDYLMPNMGGTPVDELTTYRSLFILDTLDGDAAKAGGDRDELMSLTAAVDPFASDLPAAEHVPAVGVLTTHEQGWVQKGLALGNLLHSICLAPGEVTKVAVIDWQRRTAGTSTESTEQGEAVTSAIDQSRAVNEVQQAVANEAQSGGSSTSAAAATAQAGVSVGGLFAAASASAATSTTSALTAQFSLGSRRLAAESTNTLTQRTAETSQALRSRRAAVVREVSEQEAESLSSRVLANYNRRHALNIEYFEVLQLYRIETRLADWDRCLFVPLQPVDVNDENVRAAHRADLVDILRARGQQDLLERLMLDDPDVKKELENRRNALASQVQQLADERELATKTSMLYADLIPHIREYFTYKEEAEKLEAGTENPRIKAAYDAWQKLVNEALAAYQGLVKGSSSWVQYPLPEQPTDVGFADKLQGGVDARKSEITRIDTALEQATQEIEKIRARLAELALPVAHKLMADQLVLSQQLWLRMDPYQVYRVLQKYTVSGEPLTMLVDPHPVGVFGNYLAFRWGFEHGDEGEQARREFEDKYLRDGGNKSDDATKTPDDAKTVEVAVPTSGVFAEAVLGRGEAAETIDETRLWKWDDAPIPILPPELDKFTRDRAKAVDLKSGDFAAALAALRAQSPADISHLGGILSALSNGSMFRDMGGLAQAVSLADKVAALSGSGASDAGKRAAEIHAKMLDTFVEVLNSDVGKAAVAEFMLPGAGATVLGAGGAGDKAPAKKATGGASQKGDPKEPAAPAKKAAAPAEKK